MATVATSTKPTNLVIVIEIEIEIEIDTASMPEIKKYKVTEPYLNLHCGLAEGPFWERSRHSLRFVDIVNSKLHFVDLHAGPSSLQTWDLPFNVGTTADIEGNETEFIAGGKYGFAIFNRETGQHRWVAKFWTAAERETDRSGGKPGIENLSREERMRANDGAVDVAGRYWVGTMNDPPVVRGNITDEGVLFRLDPDLSLHRVHEPVTMPNGTSWSLDNKWMYFTDSPSGTITKSPYDPATGKADFSKSEVFFKCPYEGGVPDGHAQDEEGCFWIAIFGAGRVVRVSPEGQIVAEVEVPTRCVTCPGFAGTDLFITTASEKDPEKYPESKEYGGAIFCVNVGVRGCPINRFKMDVARE